MPAVTRHRGRAIGLTFLAATACGLAVTTTPPGASSTPAVTASSPGPVCIAGRLALPCHQQRTARDRTIALDTYTVLLTGLLGYATGGIYPAIAGWAGSAAAVIHSGG